MVKSLTLSLLLFLNLIVITIGADIAAPAPAPSADCTQALFSLADCFTFVQQGSNLTKPEGDCCSSLKKVVKEEPHCLCEAFAGGSNLGNSLDINVTKALTLPSVCKVKTPSASKCHIAGAPGGAPAGAPSEGMSPATTGEASPTAAAPAPAAKSIAPHLTVLQPTTTAVLLLLCFSVNLSIDIWRH